MLNTVRAFIDDRLAIGDRLGETFYAIWMVVVSIGILNSEMTITPELTLYVVAVAFGVNLVWGAIDGVTVMIGLVIERAGRDQIVFGLKGRDAAKRAQARDHLADTIVAALPAADRERILDQIAAAAAGPDPATRRYAPTAGEWGYAAAIIAVDVLLVVPLVAPLLLIGDPHTAIYVSRLIATVLFAALGAAYAHNLNRNPMIAAAGLGALGFALFSAAFAAGW